MKLTSQSRVGDIVRENFNTATVLTRMKIDYCCSGNRPLSEACADAGADVDKVLLKLRRVLSPVHHEQANVQRMPPDELCDYITRRHHNYIRDRVPVLTENLEKICQVHGKEHPGYCRIRDLFGAISAEMVRHMQEEEMILFAYIRHMAVCGRKGETLHTPSFGTVINPIHMLVSEHREEGDRYGEIRKLTGNYSAPEDACDSLRVTYRMLEEFESDLRWHFHLENNILYPEAREMEKQLLRK